MPNEVVTEMGPVVAPVGTVAAMDVELFTVTVVAATPLNFTDCTLTKFVPVMVI